MYAAMAFLILSPFRCSFASSTILALLDVPEVQRKLREVVQLQRLEVRALEMYDPVFAFAYAILDYWFVFKHAIQEVSSGHAILEMHDPAPTFKHAILEVSFEYAVPAFEFAILELLMTCDFAILKFFDCF